MARKDHCIQSILGAEVGYRDNAARVLALRTADGPRRHQRQREGPLPAATSTRRRGKVNSGERCEMSYLEKFKIHPGARVKLGDVDPTFKDRHESREDAAQEIER